MKYDRKEPCKSCPYRKDAKVGFWDASHFVRLMEDDANEMHGSVYLCHEDGKKQLVDAGYCVGWLISQRERGTPSIMLRLRLMQGGEEAADQFNKATCASPLFTSVREMCEVNLKAIMAMANKSSKSKTTTTKARTKKTCAPKAKGRRTKTAR